MAQSFYSVIPEEPREDMLRSYLAFLEERNGTVDSTVPYPKREAWMRASESWDVRHKGELSAEQFERQYVRFDAAEGLSPALTSLLAFVKMNAAEAYGVEIVGKKRRKAQLASGVFGQVEALVGQEETYHTRILLGASRQFGMAPPKSPYRPPLALKVLIGSLAYSPKAIFHPILLGSEIAGVYEFTWMLERVGEIFKDEPALRETMEQRLIEILIDELGHVAFNRLAVGPKGLEAARKIAPHVASNAAQMTPELLRLGWGDASLPPFDAFDYAELPEEVRRRGFFV